ncbi:NB-ARC [Dillenia turbinata]|uniref:NB-ARC n=1 Tax=Dillenia turbinata TaxID=194707 RepID=A0AAN8W574_9MAGN
MHGRCDLVSKAWQGFDIRLLKVENDSRRNEIHLYAGGLEDFAAKRKEDDDDDCKRVIMKKSWQLAKCSQFSQREDILGGYNDVWVKEAWDELSPAFPWANLGSKLIIATRTQGVPLHADPHCFVHEPRSPTGEEAWQLLLKKVEHVIEDERREEANHFHRLGKEMVKKCSGLSLAIVVLGGLSATKR